MGKEAGLPAFTLVSVLDPTPGDLHGLRLAHLRLQRFWGAHNNAWRDLNALGWLWEMASTGLQCLTLATKDPVAGLHMMSVQFVAPLPPLPIPSEP